MKCIKKELRDSPFNELDSDDEILPNIKYWNMLDSEISWPIESQVWSGIMKHIDGAINETIK